MTETDICHPFNKQAKSGCDVLRCTVDSQVYSYRHFHRQWQEKNVEAARRTVNCHRWILPLDPVKDGGYHSEPGTGFNNDDMFCRFDGSASAVSWESEANANKTCSSQVSDFKTSAISRDRVSWRQFSTYGHHWNGQRCFQPDDGRRDLLADWKD
jgi:hypothetical protein